MGSLLCRRSPIYSPTLPDCYQIPIRPFTPEASHQGEFGPNASQSFVIWSRYPFLFSCSSVFNLLFNFFYYLIQKKEREQKGPFPQIFIEHDPCTRFLISIADDLRLNHPIFSYLSRLCLAFFCAPPSDVLKHLYENNNCVLYRKTLLTREIIMFHIPRRIQHAENKRVTCLQPYLPRRK